MIRPRYSLRKLWIGLSLLCLWMGWIVAGARQQRMAVRYLQERGCDVAYDYEYDRRGTYTERPSPLPRAVVELCGRDLFHDVVAVGLTFDADIDETTNALVDLKELHTLLVECNGGCSDEFVKRIAAIGGLETLHLVNGPLSDRAIDAISAMNGLRQLDLSGTDVDTKKLAALSMAGQLDKIFLYATPAMQSGIQEVRRLLPGCEIFDDTQWR